MADTDDDPRTRAGQTKRRRTHAKLVEAAEWIIKDQGHAPRIEAIADAAGVSTATFYNFFPSRGALFNEIFNIRVVDVIRERMSKYGERWTDPGAYSPRDSAYRSRAADLSYDAIFLWDSWIIELTVESKGLIRGLLLARLEAGPAFDFSSLCQRVKIVEAEIVPELQAGPKASFLSLNLPNTADPLYNLVDALTLGVGFPVDHFKLGPGILQMPNPWNADRDPDAIGDYTVHSTVARIYERAIACLYSNMEGFSGDDGNTLARNLTWHWDRFR